MRIHAKCVTIIMGLWLALFALPSEARGETPKQVSSQALLDIIKLNKGKVVVVNFFATWCPPCREEIPGLVGLAKSYPASKVAVIGVSVDQDPALVMPFMKKLKANYPVFHAGDDVPGAYGVHTIPHNVIYNTKGEMAANVTGYVTEADLKEFIDDLLKPK